VTYATDYANAPTVSERSLQLVSVPRPVPDALADGVNTLVYLRVDHFGMVDTRTPLPCSARPGLAAVEVVDQRQDVADDRAELCTFSGAGEVGVE